MNNDQLTKAVTNIGNDLTQVAKIVANQSALGVSLVDSSGNKIKDYPTNTDSNRPLIKTTDLIDLTEDAYGVQTIWNGITDPKKSINITPDIAIDCTKDVQVKVNIVKTPILNGDEQSTTKLNLLNSTKLSKGYYATTSAIPLVIKKANLKNGTKTTFTFDGVGEGLENIIDHKSPTISLIYQNGSFNVECQIGHDLDQTAKNGAKYGVSVIQLRLVSSNIYGNNSNIDIGDAGNGNNSDTNGMTIGDSKGIDFNVGNYVENKDLVYKGYPTLTSLTKLQVTPNHVVQLPNYGGFQFWPVIRKTEVSGGVDGAKTLIPIMFSEKNQVVAGNYVTDLPIPISIYGEDIPKAKTTTLEISGIGDNDYKCKKAPTLSIYWSLSSSNGLAYFSIDATQGYSLDGLEGPYNGARYDVLIQQINTFKTPLHATKQLASGSVIASGSITPVSNGISIPSLITLPNGLDGIGDGLKITLSKTISCSAKAFSVDNINDLKLNHDVVFKIPRKDLMSNSSIFDLTSQLKVGSVFNIGYDDGTGVLTKATFTVKNVNHEILNYSYGFNWKINPTNTGLITGTVSGVQDSKGNVVTTYSNTISLTVPILKIETYTD